MNRLLNLLLVLSLFFLTAFKEVEDSSVLGTKWVIYAVKDGDKEIRFPMPLVSTQPIQAPFIEFKTKGRINGFSGSNLFNTTLDLKKDGSVKIGQIATTRMAVRYPEFERAFLNTLRQTASFALEGNSLALKSSDGEILAVAEKLPAPKEPTLSLSKTKWIPIYIESGKPFSAMDDKMPFIEFSSPDKINGFAGDNIFNGSYKLAKNGDLKIGDNLAVTMMMGVNGEYEYAFLQALRKVAKAEIKDAGMLCLFDKKGNLLMHLRPFAESQTKKNRKKATSPYDAPPPVGQRPVAPLTEEERGR